jgi:hypothetical protein
MKYPKQFIGLFLLLFGTSLPAEAPPVTALQLQVQWVNAAGDNTHWADKNNCACTLTVVQLAANGAASTIYTGTTDSGGDLNVNLPALNPSSTYTATLYSTYYQMNIYTTFLVSGFVAPVPVKSLQLHLRFTRPQVNGIDQAAPVPADATPPTLTSNTQLVIGF